MKARPVVLCIDEDANRAYSLAQLVRRVGLQPKVVRSVSEAEQALRVFMPDAVVVRDHSRMLPNQLTKFAQQLRVDAPIFVLARCSSSRWLKLRANGVEIFMEDSDSRLGCALAEVLHCRSSNSEEPLNGDDSIAISALMLSADEPLIAVVQDLANRIAIELHVVSQLPQAMGRIATKKYQAVLLDWRNDVAAAALMNAVRGSASNATDVVFAFVANGDHATQATRLGANFIVPQPFTVEAVGPYLRAGYGLMIHELRRYFRSPISIPIELRRHNGAHTSARTLNLSGGGLAIRSSTRLSVGEDVAATFQVPGTNLPASVNAIVCWADDSGRAGLRFSHLLPSVAETLDTWLATCLEERLTKQTGGLPGDSAA